MPTYIREKFTKTKSAYHILHIVYILVTDNKNNNILKVK